MPELSNVVETETAGVAVEVLTDCWKAPFEDADTTGLGGEPKLPVCVISVGGVTSLLLG